MMKRLLVIIVFISLTKISNSQVNFNGHWTLKDKQLVSGPDYANSMPKEINIILVKDSLYVKLTSLGPDETEIKSSQTFPVDGTVAYSISSSSGRKLGRSLKRLRKNEIILTTVVYKLQAPGEVELTRVETWVLDPVSRQLKINKKSIETTAESWETQGTFVKN